jgi:hypothetical protein
MPQLNIFIFFDGVFSGFFFVFGFLLFLKFFLPFLGFFNKYNEYFTLYLLKEFNLKYLVFSFVYNNYLLFLKNYIFCIHSIYMQYNAFIDSNFIFFGFYGINEI